MLTQQPLILAAAVFDVQQGLSVIFEHLYIIISYQDMGIASI